MRWWVASSSRPPNVTMGASSAKYMKQNVAMHCRFNESLKSDQYHGALRFMSAIRPPNNLPVRFNAGSLPWASSSKSSPWILSSSFQNICLDGKLTSAETHFWAKIGALAKKECLPTSYHYIMFPANKMQDYWQSRIKVMCAQRIIEIRSSMLPQTVNNTAKKIFPEMRISR